MPTAVGALLILLAPPAWAHAGLVGTDPADGQVLAESPAAVTVTFTEPIRLADSGNQLLDAAGEPVAAAVVARDATVVFTPDAPLADGSYIVSWRVISVDTHPVAGGILFSVGQPSETVAAHPTSSGDRQVNLLRLIGVALRYAGVLGFAGLAWFWLFVAPAGARRSARFATEVRRAQTWLAVTGTAAALVVVPLATAWQNGSALRQLGSGRLWAEALADPAAVAALLIAAGIATAVVGVRRHWRPAVAVGCAVALGALVVEGHTRTFGPGWLVLTADLAHLAAGALWFGGLVGLIIALLPGRELRPRDVAAMVGRFSAAAMWLVALLAAAAVALWWRIAGGIGGLVTSYYGELVLVKAGIAAAVLVVAAWNRFRLVPGVLAMSSGAPAQLTRLRRTVGAEALALVAVLGVTAVMVSQEPPQRTAAETPARAVTASGDGASVAITLRPGSLGTNSLQLALTRPDGSPLDPGEVPALTVQLVETPIGPFTHPLTRVGAGEYQAIVDFPLAGTWRIDLTVRVSEFSAPVLSAEVTIR